VITSSRFPSRKLRIVASPANYGRFIADLNGSLSSISGNKFSRRWISSERQNNFGEKFSFWNLCDTRYRHWHLVSHINGVIQILVFCITYQRDDTNNGILYHIPIVGKIPILGHPTDINLADNWYQLFSFGIIYNCSNRTNWT